jgi:hypothetical protein
MSVLLDRFYELFGDERGSGNSNVALLSTVDFSKLKITVQTPRYLVEIDKPNLRFYVLDSLTSSKYFTSTSEEARTRARKLNNEEGYPTIGVACDIVYEDLAFAGDGRDIQEALEDALRVLGQDNFPECFYGLTVLEAVEIFKQIVVKQVLA